GRRSPAIAWAGCWRWRWRCAGPTTAPASPCWRRRGTSTPSAGPRRHGSAAGIGESLPVEAIPALFFALDPLLAERKFRRFAALDPAGEAARVFVALEDWINDGVPLAGPVAAECFRSWYGANDPAGGRWRVAGRTVVPEDLECPALVVVPSRDRIVPPRSAAALAAALPQATVLRPPLGHIGMMAGGAARAALWSEIARWLAGF